MRKKFRILIEKVSKYDHDPTENHHLLDKVALRGTVDDCKSFNVKRSTALAKTRVSGSKEFITLMPRVGLRKFMKCMNMLDVDDPTLPGSKARPKGVLAILIFCYIGLEPPTSNKQFELVGAAMRGRFVHIYANEGLSNSERLHAFYSARYLTKTGMLGGFGNVIEAPVIL